MYVRNAWYVACTADEIAGAPLGRTICGQRMVLFRGEGGAVVGARGLLPAPRRAALARHACATTAASSAATTAW